MTFGAGIRTRVASFQWSRGLRAAIAIGSIMTVCHLLGVPPAAATLGGFDALLVDNGGPYRTRLITMALTLVGGSVAMVIGCMAPHSLIVVLPLTTMVCFAVIFARVLSQPWTSASLLVLVLYFAGLGGVNHTWATALLAAEMVLLGGLWAVLLSLLLWPVDPFRPARLAVAACYSAVAKITAAMPAAMGAEVKGDAKARANDWRRRQRALLETARTALAATVARAPSRTARARNLTVLLETCDLLQARNSRLAEIAELSATAADAEAVRSQLVRFEQWLAGAEAAVYEALAHRPADAAAAFAHDGSQRVQFVIRRRVELARDATASSPMLEHLMEEQRDALFEIEVAFDAVRAIWTGSEVRRASAAGERAAVPTGWDLSWLDTAQANWTLSSAAMRHALRMGLVGAADVLVMRLIHINHGYWLPMTSIILLQPYSAGTARKSVQRVTGTVAGGILAALLAAALPGQISLIVMITLMTSMTLATYSVDYAIYSFFLTPAFVLLSLPHPHDWRYAGIRIGTTLAGAAIAIVAMRLLWPERAEEELGGLLRRGVAAEAAYLRAMLRFWRAPDRRAAEREILAPARRACGLASNDAEEAVDRLMQEPGFGMGDRAHIALRNEALTFATYLRRLTQSITTLAAVGSDSPSVRARLQDVAARFDLLDGALLNSAAATQPEDAMIVHATIDHTTIDHSTLDHTTTGDASIGDAMVEEQLQRIERQAGILERTAAPDDKPRGAAGR